jgi:hypothetical protein
MYFLGHERLDRGGWAKLIAARHSSATRLLCLFQRMSGEKGGRRLGM